MLKIDNHLKRAQLKQYKKRTSFEVSKSKRLENATEK